MIKLNLICVFAFLLFMVAVEAGIRFKRSPQFGASASASAQSFGNPGRNFGAPRPFGGNFGPPGPPGGNFGPPGPPGGNFGRPGHSGGHPRGGGSGGVTINISKSVSISNGGTSSSSAQASSRTEK